MEIPAKALLIVKREPAGSMVPGKKNLKAMEKLLSGLSVEVDYKNSEIMRVQYNPSSLSLRANASTVQIKSLQQSLDASCIQQQERPPSMVLSVQLVFDAVNTKDAFMADKIRLSAGDVVSDGAAIAAAAVKGGYTVRPQIDGLMGMIMDMNTRGVMFVWQDMAFEGQVKELQSSYNMFNMSGNPISGSIRMDITQNIDAASTSYWDKALERCFAKGAAGKNALEKAGNLININL